MRSFSPASLLAPTLDALAEGALAWVVYVALVGTAAGRQSLGLVEFATAAGLGILLARRNRAPGVRACVLVTAMLLVGMAGWLADPSARASLAGAGISRAMGVHAPGWLLGATVWRGFAHRDPASDDRVTSRLLTLGFPLLALPWLIHLGPTPGAGAGELLFGSGLFVAASLLAIAHGRIASLGLDPAAASAAWTRTVVAVTAGLAGVALAGTAVLDASLASLAGIVGVPLVEVLAAFGRLVAPIAAMLAAPLRASTASPSPLAQPETARPAADSVVSASPASPLAGVVLLLLAAVGITLLVRYRHLLQSPRIRPPDARREERSFVRPHLRLRLALPGLRAVLPHRQPAPADAATAYVAALHVLAADPELARNPAESPLVHAARLRARGFGGLALPLLAADFQLERYGARRLPAREHARAVSRWQRIRTRVSRTSSPARSR